MIRLSVVIVTFNSAGPLGRTLPPLLDQLGDGDELIVVDNASADDTRKVVASLAPRATLVANEANLGFAAGCNAGAAAATGDLLVFLNPDCLPKAGFAMAIRRPLAEQLGWAAWMGVVASDGGRLINSDGGVVHYTGIAWAGNAGRRLADGSPPREASGQIGFLSGACLAIPRRDFHDAGGFASDFFMYHEDVDLSLRLRLEGGALGVERSAVVDHDYQFAKGAAKWRLLERNRWATVLRTYPLALLLLLAPALLATELALLAVAVAGGWGRQKLSANIGVIRSMPRLLSERRAIQASRTIGAAEFAASLTAELDSPYLGRLSRMLPVRLASGAYWALVRALLGAGAWLGRATRSAAERSGRRRLLLNALITVAYLGGLAVWLGPRLDEIGTAAERLPLGTFAGVAALGVAHLGLRAEVWGVCLRAAGGLVRRRDVQSVTAAIAPAAVALNPAVGSGLRVALLRRVEPEGAPRTGQLVAAEAAINFIEGAMAVALLVVATLAVHAFPVWLAVLASAAVAVGVALIVLARARFSHRPSVEGLAVFFNARARSAVAFLVASAFACQLARVWLVLGGLGLDPTFLEVTATFIAIGVLGALVIGPTAAAATGPILVLGSGGVTVPAAAGTLLAASGLFGAMLYGLVGLRALWPRSDRSS